MPPTDVIRTATISDDGLYRYELTREWGQGHNGPMALFIMLNPSTADALVDDPTIVRCQGFAQREHCAGMKVVNLYAFRATQPADLWRAEDPVGPENDAFIRAALAETVEGDGPVIAAWGAHAKPHRVYKVKQMEGMERAVALKFTKTGAPGHPLYIAGDAPLMPLRDGVFKR